MLQLLIAVLCHIIVRQRGDCSAPFVTGFGIATGIAVMLMTFGPSVIFLYQKRLGEYERDEPVRRLLNQRPISKVVGTLIIIIVALFFFLPREAESTEVGAIQNFSKLNHAVRYLIV